MARRLVAAVFAFLAMPGMVAFAVPLLLLRPSSPGPLSIPGLVLLAIGLVLLLWCVRDFFVSGRGSLAPWATPTTLVTVGLYRVSRNPMYVAVAMILWGWALAFRSPALASYALVISVAFHVRVVFGEEPWLAQRHGSEWERYTARVPRWLGPPSR